MHVTSRPVAGGRAGFSLLEAVVAAALLLTTVAAVTACVTGVSRAGARLERTMRADRATLAVAERLRQLPYCAASYPVRVGEAPAADLVAAVFPHAAAWRSTATARYVAAAGDPQAAAGSFVTVVVEQGVRVTCVARFLAGPEGAPLGPAALAGWDLATSPHPPAPALEVVVSSTAREGSGSGARSVRLVRGALGPVLAARGPEGGG